MRYLIKRWRTDDRWEYAVDGGTGGRGHWSLARRDAHSFASKQTAERCAASTGGIVVPANPRYIADDDVSEG